MEAVVITYESGLSFDEVERLFHDRSDAYREMEGLVQKYYLHDPETGRVGGIYVFDTAEHRAALTDSDIHGSLRDAYDVQGDVEIDTYEVVLPLYDEVPTASED